VAVTALFHYSASLATLAAALWAADVVYRYAYLANVAYPKTCRIKALPARVICLTFPKGKFQYKAGQYIFVCIPEIAKLEFHPFSLSSAPYEDEVCISIRDLGDWTSKLYELAEGAGADGKEVSMLFEGPVGEPTVDINSGSYKSVLLISGGIGITPMQSICKDLLHQYMEGRPLNKVWFLWSVRDRYMVNSIWGHDRARATPPALPMSFSPNTFLRLSNTNMVRGKADVENDGRDFDPLYTEFFLTKVRNPGEFEEAGIHPEVQEYVRFGRPNFDETFAKMKEMALANGEARVAVLTCGPTAMVSDVCRKCKEYSGNGVTFDAHYEVFDF